MSIGKRNGTAIAVLAAALASTACSGKGGASPQQTGMARVAAALRGVAPGQIARVTLTISGSALQSPRSQDLTRMDDTHYAGTVTALPAGSGYTFRVEAFGATGSALFRGVTTGVTIDPGQAAPVTVNLQEVDPTPGPVSRMPAIDGMSASTATVRSGWPVSVSVTAHSPEGHALTYAWNDSCGGAFADATQPSTTWTAPATGGVCQLSVRVADGANATATTGYLGIDVQAVTPVDVRVEATINTYPVVALSAEEHVVTALPAPDGLSVGVTVDFDHTVSDPDGDGWTTSWSSSCGGSFYTTSVPGPFGLPRLIDHFHHDDPAAQCVLTFTADDGRGGVTSATVETNGRDTRHVLGLGAFHSCAIVNDRAWCWGNNGSGELGNNSTTEAQAPVQVQDLAGWVQAIAGGAYHTCALVNGGARCWGANAYGQLGNNSLTDSHVPVQVQGLTSGVQAIAAGLYHTCALVNGGAQCWGDNGRGQLGNNSTTSSSLPVQVQGLTSGVQAIAAGLEHTCALVYGGVQCWGANSAGKLGNDSTISSSVPVQVQGLASGVQAITGGGHHTCALVNGGVWCWGRDAYGQLGNNSLTDSHVPVQVQGLTSGVQAIAGGGNHTCALVNGSAECWGYNEHGQLGNNSVTESHVPVQVQGLTSSVQAIAAGSDHTCAFVNSGGIRCWGYNGNGQLGNDSSSRSSLVPVQVQFPSP